MELKMPEIAMPDVHMPDVTVPDFKKIATTAATVAAKFLAEEVAKAKSFDPIGLVGLQRRPSTVSRVFGTLGLITAGAAVGAGVVLLVSPGAAETRKSIRRSVVKLLGLPEEKQENKQEAKSDDNQQNDVKADADNDSKSEDRSRANGQDDEYNQALLNDGQARRAPRAPMPSKTHD